MSEVKEMISIPKEEYDELLADQVFLNCLQAAGVDNWDGYAYAQEEFSKTNPDD